MIRCFGCVTLLTTLGIALAGPAAAHFPWLATDDEGHAVLWFGEGLDDRTYHMPEAVAKVEIRRGGDETPLKMQAVDSEAFVGLRSVEPVEGDDELFATVTYGLYHGTKLTYHVEHLPGPGGQRLADRAREAEMQTVLARQADGGLAVSLLRDGKPVSGAAIKLFSGDGRERAVAESDSDGRVRFPASAVQPGLNAVMAGVTDKQAAGEHRGESYSSTSDYLTATFVSAPGSPSASASSPNPDQAEANVVVAPAALPHLPEELTSFGAAVASEVLYVYGGHTGEAHSYSTAEQSGRLWALNLAAGEEGEWEQAAEGPRLQGLAMVAHGGRPIRLGGFTAMNEIGDEHDLRSQTSVAAFDRESGKWQDLAPLPEPRSSFDAAVLGDRVYVFGGWKLDGESEETSWHATAWSLDLSEPTAAWEPLADMPVHRRALAVAAHGGELYLIGGMNRIGGPTTDVLVYDPAADRYREGPALPGEGMTGFGAAAFAIDGSLYASVYDGHVYRLAADGEGWEAVGKLETGRFFHRMVPTGDRQLVIVGGANMRAGKFTELISVTPR